MTRDGGGHACVVCEACELFETHVCDITVETASIFGPLKLSLKSEDNEK